MAGTLTHFKFGEEVYKELNLKDINKDLFIMGNQGHDLLNFIKLREISKRKKYNEIVKRLQRVKIENFIKKFDLTDLEIRSFIYGYICHEILDNKVHPYINKRVSYNHNEHQLLESIIDRKVNYKIKDIPRKVKISQKAKEKLVISFNDYFNSDIGDRLINSLKRVYPFLKIYRSDLTGIKRLGYKFIDKLNVTKQKFEFLSYHYPKKYLNIDIEEFLKLYEEAKNDAIKYIESLEKVRKI